MRTTRPLHWLAALGLASSLALAPAALAQPRPYIGFAYPAGGRQGTTFRVRLGGQGLDGVHAALVTGSGLTAKVTEFQRRLNNQEVQLLDEQLRELKRATSTDTPATAPPMTSDAAMMTSTTAPHKTAAGAGSDEAKSRLVARIEKRTHEFVQTPACAAIATVVTVEVMIAPAAQPGERELRLVTTRGVSNPLIFQVGQLPEYARKPMLTSRLHVLGKEAQSLRKRPADEVEERIVLPCTVNGQIAPGEVNRYRFEARPGQRLVITTQARQLIPFIADAVPGWFQSVLVLYDADGRELAYADDYRFKPDPTILYEAPKHGEYVLAIHDSLYRGREDFVYRLTIGETPLVTSIFPLGGRAGEQAQATIQTKGWNLEGAEFTPPAEDWGAETHRLSVSRQGLHSNRVPFALDALPEGLEQEPNNHPTQAQKVTLPLIINGRVGRPDDWDVFAFAGRSNETIVAEVSARRLDSPLDSVLKLSDAEGRVLRFNDDHEDLGAGENTHHADSYLTAKLPADGTYYVHLGDTARHGGEEYGYRLRLSPPQPDFALHVVPSSVGIRGKSTATANVYVLRKDGFNSPVKLALKDPPAGFALSSATLSATQTVTRLTLKSSLVATKEPVNLSIIGTARIGGQEIVREAVPSEDRMQAFLWRHLVPAREFKVLVFDPSSDPPPRRLAQVGPPSALTTNVAVAAVAAVATNAPTATNAASGTNVTAASAAVAGSKPKFTQQQIASRLRQLRLLFEEGLLTATFYEAKVAECEAAL